MRVLFIPTANSGITYWRMFNFAQAMNRQGIAEADFLWWQKDLNEIHPWQYQVTEAVTKHAILGEMNHCVQNADVVIMGMVHTRAALETFYAIKDAYPDKPVLADIDDNILSTPTYNPADAFYHPGSMFRGVAVDQFKAADGIICSTPYLAELYSDFGDTYVVTNAIDRRAWQNLKRKNKPGIRIGWAGGASHDEDLAILKPAVDAVLKARPEAKFVFVHGIPAFFKNRDGVECVHRFARIDKYPAFLAAMDFDIGLAPLVDNAFNRGKSNLRWLEYSALGIPTVASRVGHFAETIQDSQDGLLADSPEAFTAAILRLVEDRELRRNMGATAKARIDADFDADKTAAAYVEVLRGIIERGPVKKAPALASDMAAAPLAGVLAGDILPEEVPT